MSFAPCPSGPVPAGRPFTALGATGVPGAISAAPRTITCEPGSRPRTIASPPSSATSSTSWATATPSSTRITRSRPSTWNTAARGTRTLPASWPSDSVATVNMPGRSTLPAGENTASTVNVRVVGDTTGDTRVTAAWTAPAPSAIFAPPRRARRPASP
ncbi:hypothetical protein [Nannocystis pusilla]|uniref:hypothetical protein n=1 Tax=Nannocystis pusilla TaxID=889268 RepID=UPI003B7685A7